MLITFPKVKKKEGNEQTYLYIRSGPFVRLCLFVQAPIPRKTKKGTLNTFLKVKKKQKKKEMNELYLYVRSGPFVRLRPFIRTPFLHSLNKKEKGTLSTSPEIKKQIQIKKNLPLCSFRTVRSASSVRSGSISLKERRETLITFLESNKRKKKKAKRTYLCSFALPKRSASSVRSVH